MTKAMYSVVVIRKGRENDFVDFWEKSKYINASGEKLDSEIVGFTEMVKAKNKQEAESLIKEKHPDLIIYHEATKRLG
jgi:hypothetical protein